MRPEQVTGSDYKKHDVIVIGAGMAGLEAANQLDSKGLDVMVL
ncbi:MAG: FAD-binding protein, partial [Thaumarchaeota archaeon]|nr:FAD-binding protein [Nitrososphaerota archaeon]